MGQTRIDRYSDRRRKGEATRKESKTKTKRNENEMQAIDTRFMVSASKDSGEVPPRVLRMQIVQ
jgi:hypothetical protein